MGHSRGFCACLLSTLACWTVQEAPSVPHHHKGLAVGPAAGCTCLGSGSPRCARSAARCSATLPPRECPISAAGMVCGPSSCLQAAEHKLLKRCTQGAVGCRTGGKRGWAACHSAEAGRIESRDGVGGSETLGRVEQAWCASQQRMSGLPHLRSCSTSAAQLGMLWGGSKPGSCALPPCFRRSTRSAVQGVPPPASLASSINCWAKGR